MFKRWIPPLAAAASLLAIAAALSSPTTAYADPGEPDDSPATVAEQMRSAGFEPAAYEQGDQVLTARELEELTGIDVVSPGAAMEENDTKEAVSTSWWACHPKTRMDNLDRRRGEARVHGWWLKNDCESNRARVTVWLQQYGCSSRFGCAWFTRDTGSRVISPGTSKRTLAHKNCNSSEWTGWRAIVDVDVLDEWDVGDRKYQIENLYCRDF